MLTRGIIPCLDVKDGQTVKGVNFVDLRQAGDPVELGQRYATEGADELVFLDITATLEGRGTFAGLVRRIAEVLNIPFTVGGGITSVSDVSRLLDAGADKISINTSAVLNPDLIGELAVRFGSQCVVLAADVNVSGGEWVIHAHGGRKPTSLRALEWIKEAENRGAGEILLTSMQHDGTKSGFALDITRRVSESVSIPVIASGGAGKPEHFRDVFTEGKSDAALAAGIFHFGEVSLRELKEYLRNQKISVR